MNQDIVELERTLGDCRAHIKQAKHERRAAITQRREQAATHKELFWKRQAYRTSCILKGQS